MANSRTPLLAVLALTLAARIPAAAQQADSAHAAPAKEPAPALPNDGWGSLPARWQFGAGGYLPTLSSSATLGGKVLPATPIDLEDIFGLTPHTQSIDLFASYRFSQRNVISLEYFGYGRTGTRTLSDSLIINDSLYEAGANVRANATLQYFGFTYRYYIWRRQRWELGAGLGIDALDLSASFAAKANLSDHYDSVETKGSIVAPVPLIGFYADWEAFRHFYLRGSFQTFFLKYQQYSGAMHDRQISAEWYPFTNYGLGAGWHYVGIDIKKEDAVGNRYLELGYSIQGLTLYATAAFGAPQPVPPRPSVPITEPPPGDDFGLVPRNASFYLGAFGPSVDTKAELESPSGPHDRIDLENALGLPSHVSSVDLGASLRIANKSLITASYFSFARDGSKSLADTIHWGDATYPAGVTVDAGSTLSYLGFSYRYYFLREKRWQLGAGIGIDEVDAKTHLAVQVTTPGQADSVQRHNSLNTPAPMLGLYFDWEPARSLFLRAGGQYIAVTVGSVGGSITDDRLTAEWYAFKNYGIGAGYHYIDADITKTLPNGDTFDLTYKIQGFYYYLVAAF
ncbi:MAG TPA: hypothetical protein VMT93_01470 [Gemmatimonadaceae bacterium]|nr:hypothetical protein [Gemmatimonadaceae bacterium]